MPITNWQQKDAGVRSESREDHCHGLSGQASIASPTCIIGPLLYDCPVLGPGALRMKEGRSQPLRRSQAVGETDL